MISMDFNGQLDRPEPRLRVVYGEYINDSLGLGALAGLVRDLRHYRRVAPLDPLQEFKHDLGRVVLVGLEILVASTIIKIAMVDLTLVSVGLLTGMIAVRTIISWTIILEYRGRLPWEPSPHIREGKSKVG